MTLLGVECSLEGRYQRHQREVKTNLLTATTPSCNPKGDIRPTHTIAKLLVASRARTQGDNIALYANVNGCTAMVLGGAGIIGFRAGSRTVGEIDGM